MHSKTLPKVPVPNKRYILYLWPNFSPILYLKWGVARLFRVADDTDSETLSIEEEDDEDDDLKDEDEDDDDD